MSPADPKLTTGSFLTVVQTAIPDYRLPFFDLLAAKSPGGVVVLAGDDHFDATVRTGSRARPTIHLRNRYLLGRRLLWQVGVVEPAISARVLVTGLNPRVLSTWLVLIARRVTRRPTALWGHAWPRRGPHSGTDWLRHAMRLLATALLPYTESEAAQLRRRMPRARVLPAPNALYSYSVRLNGGAHSETAADFIYVGRLVEAKKPGLVVEAFLHALPHLPAETRLLLVGGGPLREELETRAEAAGQRILVLGARSDFDELRELFAGCLASVIPGYAGLSLTQSLWFGVPALIARDEPHAPEIEAAVEGENALFFESDSVESLCSAILEVAQAPEPWRARRSHIARACASRYSLEAMVEAFLRIAREVTA